MTKIIMDMKTFLELEKIKDKTPEQEQAVESIRQDILDGEIELRIPFSLFSFPFKGS